MRIPSVLSIVLLAATAGAALAGPRDTAIGSNIPSDAPNTGGNLGVPITANYQARFARISGTLTKVQSGTFANEAMLLFYPGNSTDPRQIVSTTPINSYAGSISIDTFVRFSHPLTVESTQTLQIGTIESYDDGAGPDSTWTTLRVTLNDGPPTAATSLVADFGLVAGATQYSTLMPAGAVRWYKFTLGGSGAYSGFGTYLDIDTEGSNVTAGSTQSNDTVVALYDENGIVVGYDDDDGSALLSQMSFGAGSRPAIGSSEPYDGRDGDLPAGTYYLRVAGYNGNPNPQPGWDYPSTGSDQAGTVHVNIRTNSAAPLFCAGDFNKDGSVAVQDIFDFLSAWFAGCP